MRLTAAVGVTLQDIQTLATLGLVEISANDVTPSSTAVSQAPAVIVAATVASQLPATSAGLDNIDFAGALNAAITVCSTTGFKGFGLNMSLTGVDSLEKLQKLAPEIRRVAGDTKYKPLHELIFGKAL